MLMDIGEAESARLPAAASLGQARERLDESMDALNLRYGRDTVSVFSSLAPKPWAMRREAMSPCYTTRWADGPMCRSPIPIDTQSGQTALSEKLAICGL
jgi:DNA polymerase V